MGKWRPMQVQTLLEVLRIIPGGAYCGHLGSWELCKGLRQVQVGKNGGQLSTTSPVRLGVRPRESMSLAHSRQPLPTSLSSKTPTLRKLFDCWRLEQINQSGYSP